MHKDLGKKQAEDQEYDVARGFENHPADSDPAGMSGIFFTKRAAHQRVYTDAESYGKRNEQVLHREGKRDRSERVFAYSRHKYAVHDVVKCLDQH